MAKRQKDIHIEILTGNLYIYSDLIGWQIEEIEGVVSADDREQEDFGYIIAYVDQRYDVQEIKAEIEELARNGNHNDNSND